MKISSKARYGLAAIIFMANSADETMTLSNIAEKLNTSKLYLEQIFAILKKTDLIVSTKGINGGYKLSRSPQLITIYEIINGLDNSVFEKTAISVTNINKDIETAMQNVVWKKLDENNRKFLSKITVEDMLEYIEVLDLEGNINFSI